MKVWIVIRDDGTWLLNTNKLPATFRTRDDAVKAALKAKGDNSIQRMQFTAINKATPIVRKGK